MRGTTPGPKGEPVFGNARQYARNPLRFAAALERAYGGVARFSFGPADAVMLADPAHVERVLVSEADRFPKPEFQDDALGDLLGDGLLLSEGETWERQRRLANPAFDTSRLSGLSDRIVDHAEAMVEGWTPGEVRDVEVDLTEVTLRVIADLMLGVTLDDRQLGTVRENLEPLGRRFEPNSLRFVAPDWLPTPEDRTYRRALRNVERVIDDVVARRRGTEGTEGDADAPTDLLSILLRARGRGEQSDEQIRDEVMTMLLAGHDTTALTLTYALYLLSEHPDAERRVHDELDELDGRPTMADVRAFDYVERVVTETMRLYPPVYVVFREATADVAFDGHRVEAGTTVMLPQWAVHRSSRHWASPGEFDPDRWLPERRGDRHRFAYFPFGGGPRHCIGKHLALLEAQLILATVASRYRLDYAGDGLELNPSLTIHPRDGMPMRVRER